MALSAAPEGSGVEALATSVRFDSLRSLNAFVASFVYGAARLRSG